MALSVDDSLLMGKAHFTSEEVHDAMNRVMRPIFDEEIAKRQEAEKLAHELACRLELLERRFPAVRDAFGWRWAIKVGRFVVGWQK